MFEVYQLHIPRQEFVQGYAYILLSLAPGEIAAGFHSLSSPLFRGFIRPRKR